MIDDARLLPIDVPIEADIAIIGGGAPGHFDGAGLRRRPLQRRRSRERRPDLQKQEFSLYIAGKSSERATSRSTFAGSMFGGSTDKRGWAGWCKPFHDLDFERRDWVPLSGWPISKRDLASYYQRRR